jgi:hypothetical protein
MNVPVMDIAHGWEELIDSWRTCSYTSNALLRYVNVKDPFPLHRGTFHATMDEADRTLFVA